MRKFLLLLPVLVFAANVLMAQDEDLPPPTSNPKTGQTTTNKPDDDQKDFQGFKKPKKIDFSKFIIEPNFYFNIAGPEIDLGVIPYVGYKVWKELYLGAGVGYMYSGYRGLQFTDPLGNTYTANANSQTIGGGVFAQYNIWKGFFARVKFETYYRMLADVNNASVVNNPQTHLSQVNIPDIRLAVPDLLVGVGYNLLRSKNFFFPIVVSYNLLYSAFPTEYAVYPHGVVVQIGFITVY